MLVGCECTCPEVVEVLVPECCSNSTIEDHQGPTWHLLGTLEVAESCVGKLREPISERGLEPRDTYPWKQVA